MGRGQFVGRRLSVRNQTRGGGGRPKDFSNAVTNRASAPTVPLRTSWERLADTQRDGCFTIGERLRALAVSPRSERVAVANVVSRVNCSVMTDGSPPAQRLARRRHSLSEPCRLRRELVHGVPVVPVRIEHVLVDRIALLGIDLAGESRGQLVERLLDSNTYGGASGLLLTPIENEF